MPDRLAITASDLDSRIRLSRQGLHTLRELRAAQHALRLQQVEHLKQQLVDDGVMGGKAVQSFTELEPLLQILGTLPLCLGTSEVGDDD